MKEEHKCKEWKKTCNISVSGREEIYDKLLDLDNTSVGFSAMIAQAANDYVINHGLKSPPITCDTNTIFKWISELSDNDFKIWQSKLHGLINITDGITRNRLDKERR